MDRDVAILEQRMLEDKKGLTTFSASFAYVKTVLNLISQSKQLVLNLQKATSALEALGPPAKPGGNVRIVPSVASP